MALLTTAEYLQGFATELKARMALNTPKTDAEIDALYGKDDSPEEEN